MKERPILFSAPMVRAILAGRKRQTRRIVKLPNEPTFRGGWDPTTIGGHGVYDSDGNPAPERVAIGNDTTGKLIACPYGDPGDRLWVRETWRCFGGREYEYQCEPGAIIFRATDFGEAGDGDGWRPSIFMPRWASRITLEVTGVRVERVQSISKEDAVAEGARHFADLPPSRLFPDSPHQNRWSMEQPEDCGHCLGSPQSAFGNLWIKINGQESWDANPWVWVVEFKRIAADAVRTVPPAVERAVKEQLDD